MRILSSPASCIVGNEVLKSPTDSLTSLVIITLSGSHTECSWLETRTHSCEPWGQDSTWPALSEWSLYHCFLKSSVWNAIHCLFLCLLGRWLMVLEKIVPFFFTLTLSNKEKTDIRRLPLQHSNHLWKFQDIAYVCMLAECFLVVSHSLFFLSLFVCLFVWFFF